MAKLTIWAPKAQQMELESQGQRYPMERRSDGFWQLEIPSVTHASDYAFYIDRQGPFPDPRLMQREGDKPLARAGRLRLSDGHLTAARPPFESAIFYELHIGTFTPQGTFDSAIERLGYLQELGVTHLELMPIAEFAGNRGWDMTAPLFMPRITPMEDRKDCNVLWMPPINTDWPLY